MNPLTPNTHPIRFRDVDHALQCVRVEHVKAINLEGVSIANDGWLTAALNHARLSVLGVVSALPPQQRELVTAHARGVGYSRAARLLGMRTERAGVLLHEGLASVAASLRRMGLM